MKELSKAQSIALALGALIMVVSVGCVVFNFMVKPATIAFAVGVALFTSMQMMQTYNGTNFALRRLRRIMLFGDCCFILAALLMVENNFKILFPLFTTTIEGYNAYVHYIYNNWVVALLIAAVIEVYTTHRINYELSKEERS
jgi:hypothetical protein